LIGCPPSFWRGPYAPVHTEESQENIGSTSPGKNTSQFVTEEQARRAAAEIRAVYSAMWLEGDPAYHFATVEAAENHFTTRVFRTLATAGFWHVRQKNNDFRNGGGCVVC
jgi:hypothetical protein